MYEDYITFEEFETVIEQLKNSLRNSFGEFLYAREIGAEEIGMLMQFDIDIAQKCIDIDNIQTQIDALLKRLEDENISSILAMFKSQQGKLIALEKDIEKLKNNERISNIESATQKIHEFVNEFTDLAKTQVSRTVNQHKEIEALKSEINLLKNKAIRLEITKTETANFDDGTSGYIVYFNVGNHSSEPIQIKVTGVSIINDENVQHGKKSWLSGFNTYEKLLSEWQREDLAANFNNAVTGGLSKCKYIEVIVDDNTNNLKHTFLFHYRIVENVKKWFVINCDTVILKATFE